MFASRQFSQLEKQEQVIQIMSMSRDPYKQHLSGNNRSGTTQNNQQQRQTGNMANKQMKQSAFDASMKQTQSQRAASQFSQFKIPCAQPGGGQPDAGLHIRQSSSQQHASFPINDPSTAEEESTEDFHIGPPSGSYQISSDQFQLQQKGYQNSMEQQTNLHSGLDDDNLDDLDTNGLIGVIKIKDGLFICDELGAQDLEFVVANKVTRVINCAGTQLRNFWEAIGVMYLTLNWQDDEKQVLFDSAEKIPEEIYRFMEEAVDKHESVMIQSVRAQNRSCFVIATFIMRRYRWSLLKTLEFLNSRRPDLEMRPSFLAQLQQYEGRLYARGIGPKTKRWNELAESDVPELENDELILRNTYMNSQQGPLVDLSPPPGAPLKQDLLVWRDLTKDRQPISLCEENEDASDLINLINPPKQLNHYQKPASQLRSRLKNSKLHAAQRRQEQYGASSSQQNQNYMQEPATEPTPQVPPRANSANSKSKFLTKTQLGTSSTLGSSTKHETGSSSRPSSEQQHARGQLGSRGLGGVQNPSPSATQQQHQHSGGNHQPSTTHIQSSLFYPQPSFQQQKQATLQQKVLSQRPMSHQVREVSPLNSSNLNSRVAARPAAQSITGGISTQSRSGHSGSGTHHSGYVPYEPKKREMTQKIAPKMPLPMTQDLTNLPLPHGHSQTQNQHHQEQPAIEKPTNQPVKSMSNAANQSTNLQNEVPSKYERSGKLSSSTMAQHHTKQSNVGQHSRVSGSGPTGQMAHRGISPSFQSKTGDLGMRNRGTLNSSFKRQAMTAHPPAHPTHNGVTMGSGGVSGNSGHDGQHSASRPGSAPKMRTSTPNAEATTSSLVLRSQPSTQSTAGGLNSSMSISKQVDGNPSQATSSKNMLNSFRNGPVKIIGSASHLSGGAATGHTSTHAHKPRVSSSKFVNSSSTNTSVGGRPLSAPNKRPPSPSTAHNSSSAAANSSTTASGHNRVKYTKNGSQRPARYFRHRGGQWTPQKRPKPSNKHAWRSKLIAPGSEPNATRLFAIEAQMEDCWHGWQHSWLWPSRPLKPRWRKQLRRNKPKRIHAVDKAYTRARHQSLRPQQLSYFVTEISFRRQQRGRQAKYACSVREHAKQEKERGRAWNGRPPPSAQHKSTLFAKNNSPARSILLQKELYKIIDTALTFYHVAGLNF